MSEYNLDDLMERQKEQCQKLVLGECEIPTCLRRGEPDNPSCVHLETYSALLDYSTIMWGWDAH